MFAKLFGPNENQILVMINRADQLIEVRIYFQSFGVDLSSLAVSFSGDDSGFEEAKELFGRIDEHVAREMIDSAQKRYIEELVKRLGEGVSATSNDLTTAVASGVTRDVSYDSVVPGDDSGLANNVDALPNSTAPKFSGRVIRLRHITDFGLLSEHELPGLRASLPALMARLRDQAAVLSPGQSLREAITEISVFPEAADGFALTLSGIDLRRVNEGGPLPNVAPYAERRHSYELGHISDLALISEADVPSFLADLPELIAVMSNLHARCEVLGKVAAVVSPRITFVAHPEGVHAQSKLSGKGPHSSSRPLLH